MIKYNINLDEICLSFLSENILITLSLQDDYFIHPYFHNNSFIKQAFIEYLLCTRDCLGAEDMKVCLSVIYLLSVT